MMREGLAEARANLARAQAVKAKIEALIEEEYGALLAETEDIISTLERDINS